MFRAAVALEASGMTIITSETTGADWEIVIGCEVHCELATATKLFCGCRNQFGARTEHPRVPGLSRICPGRCRC